MEKSLFLFAFLAFAAAAAADKAAWTSSRCTSAFGIVVHCKGTVIREEEMGRIEALFVELISTCLFDRT